MSRFLTGLFAALALLISGVPAAAQSIGYSPNTLPLSGSCGVVTVSTPCLDLTQTWNNVATTFTGLKLNVTDTASAGSSALVELQVGGDTRFTVTKAGSGAFINTVAAYGTGGFYSVNDAGGFNLGLSSDVALRRDAANALALRNGAAAQKFNVYNTYTDASNYERGGLVWGSNNLEIGTEALGTGAKRPLGLGGNGINFRPLAGATSAIWKMDATTGHFLAVTDNTYDIGANGVSRPRNIYAGTNLVAGGALFTAGSKIAGQADGVFRFSNNAGTNSVDFTIGASNLLTLNGGLKTTGATFALQTATTLTDNAAAQVATMTNGPTAGNPTKWIAINDNGTTRYIPAW